MSYPPKEGCTVRRYLRQQDSSNLINLRRFESGYRAALQYAAQVEPHDVASWQTVVLAALLTGRYTKAVLAYKFALDCSNCTPIAKGHMLRDFALYWLRRRQYVKAQLCLASAREVHSSDGDLMGALLMVEARIHEAQGSLRTANLLHRQADKLLTNPQWVYNNLVAWLRTAVRLSDMDFAAQLRFQIRDECPDGVKNRSREAQVLALPGGPLIHKLGMRAIDLAHIFRG